jgi:DNA-binding NarL/FixJ family response regulator
MRSYNEMLRQATSPATAAGLLKTFFSIDLRETARLIRCPTLVLHSRDDAVIPFDEGREVAALIPQARFVPLESRNHLVLSTEPAWQQLIEELDGFFGSAPIAASDSTELRFDQLTAREREILEVVAQGLDNNEIARRFGVSEKTVRNQVSAILGKLEVDSRVQAVVRAREAGFGHKGHE